MKRIKSKRRESLRDQLRKLEAAVQLELPGAIGDLVEAARAMLARRVKGRAK